MTDPAVQLEMPCSKVRRSLSARQAVDGDVEFLTVKEVAERISMSRWFVYSHGRELGLVKFGGSNRYRSDRVDEYVGPAPRSTWWGVCADLEQRHSSPLARAALSSGKRGRWRR